MDEVQFTHSPTEGHLGCFQVLTIINKAVINVLCININFQPVSTVVGMCGKCVSFCMSVFSSIRVIVQFFIPTSHEWCSASLLVFGVSVLNFSHSNR